MKLYSARWLAVALGAIGASASLSWAAQIEVPGFLKFEAYPGPTGTAITGLLNDPNYPDSPAETLYMTSFETRTVYPNDSHENFGARASGFITPVEDGEYEFFLVSDDAGQLYLSTDADPANAALIAEETGCCGAFTEPPVPETSLPIALAAGQKYYIQGLYKEAGGGDYMRVAWRKVGDPTPAGSLQPIPGAYLSAMIEEGGTINITQQPASVSAAQNDIITLSVGVNASKGPVVIQWHRNGVSVPGLTGSQISYGPLSADDNGAKLKAVVSIPGAVVTSDEITLTVTADVTKPTIRRIVGSDTFDKVTVDFSEAVTDASASDVNNYSFDNGLSVTDISILSPRSVRLGTTPQTSGTTYKLTLVAIQDTAGNNNAQGHNKTFPAFTRQPGGLKFETYLQIGGTAVANLTGNAKYPGSPDFVAYVTQMTSRLIYADANTVNDYGGRMSGWIVPKETAEYQFFLRSDDGGQLSLSTDEDPANATVVASEAGCCGPFEERAVPDEGAVPPETSGAIALEAGKRYWIEALWKEGGGGDYCDIAWRKVGDSSPARFLPFINGSVLETIAAPGVFNPPTVALTSPANGAGFSVGAPVVLAVNASGVSDKEIVKVEYFERGQKVGESTSAPFSLTLLGVTADNHTYIARATDSAGIYGESSPVTISVGDEVESITLVAIDNITEWKYDRSGQDLNTAEFWTVDYDDSQWPSGKALIADETTATVEPIRTPISRFNDENRYVQTFYFRTKFNFDGEVSSRVKLKLRHVVDDGVRFFLNGEEIHRFNLGNGDITSTTSATGHENAYEGPFEIDPLKLRKGENILAAEVHQSGGSSSDVVFGAELIATVPVVRVDVVAAAIDAATEWKYDRSGQDLNTAEYWTRAFDDSGWPSGKALIADESTATVEPIRTPISRFNDENRYVQTFYFRRHFNLNAKTTARAKVKLRHVVDDGVRFFLNEQEIHRFNLGNGDITYTLSATGHENAYEGPYDIANSFLALGDNLIAAEVHQSGSSSSDVVFGAELIISIPTSDLLPVNNRATLTLTRDGASVRISWAPAGGTLESATSIAGPWTAVANAANPFTAAADGIARFFRVSQ